MGGDLLGGVVLGPPLHYTVDYLQHDCLSRLHIGIQDGCMDRMDEFGLLFNHGDTAAAEWKMEWKDRRQRVQWEDSLVVY